jgi:hypothetical protein
VRLLRLLLPIILVLVFGGVIWGGLKVEGIKDASSRALADIQTHQAGVSETASKASNDIATLSKNLVTAWKDQIKSEAQIELRELTAIVAEAKEGAAPKVRAELDGINNWEQTKKNEIGTSAGNELQKLVDSINGVVNAINDWAGNKRKLAGS